MNPNPLTLLTNPYLSKTSKRSSKICGIIKFARVLSIVIENLSERSILGTITPRTVVAETLEFGADSRKLLAGSPCPGPMRLTDLTTNFSHHSIIGGISG